ASRHDSDRSVGVLSGAFKVDLGCDHAMAPAPSDMLVTTVRAHAVPRLTDFIASLLEWMAGAAGPRANMRLRNRGRSTNSNGRYGKTADRAAVTGGSATKTGTVSCARDARPDARLQRQTRNL